MCGTRWLTILIIIIIIIIITIIIIIIIINFDVRAHVPSFLFLNSYLWSANYYY